MKTVTKEFLKNNRGCYTTTQLHNCSFMNTKNDEAPLIDIVQSEIPLIDKFWFICHKIASKKENQQIAILCAESVIFIYEKRYPENKAPREAIEAAKLYIAGRISLEQLIPKRNAAYTAAYTAAAYAADAAAYAADAAAYAADAAAYAAAYAYAADAAAYAAAYAAADAADAAAYAADAAIKKELLQILIDYVNNNLNK